MTGRADNKITSSVLSSPLGRIPVEEGGGGLGQEGTWALRWGVSGGMKGIVGCGGVVG